MTGSRGRGGERGGSAGEGSNGRRAGPKRAGRTRHETSAGGVVYRRNDGTPLFLLIRDSYGHWGFPKGHVERGERADTAALRETMEETGLRALRLAGSLGTIDWFFRFRGSLIHKSCEFFLMESETAETRPQASEGITDCRWVPEREAHDLIVYENARGVLRAAVERLSASPPRQANATSP